jgi:hypothetical protein
MNPACLIEGDNINVRSHLDWLIKLAGWQNGEILGNSLGEKWLWVECEMDHASFGIRPNDWNSSVVCLKRAKIDAALRIAPRRPINRTIHLVRQDNLGGGM